MKNLGFASTLIDRLRKWLGWCPDAREPKGLLKLVRLPFVYVPIFKERYVQVGLAIGVSIYVILSTVYTSYIAPRFFTLIEKIVGSEGSLPPEEALSVLFSLIPFMIILLIIPFMSNIIAGYTVGKVSKKLRYGIIIGITNMLLGLLASYVISYSYAQSFSMMYGNIFNQGVVSSSSIIDKVVSLVRTYLSVLASAGGGGAIGQLLGLRFWRKTQPYTTKE